MFTFALNTLKTDNVATFANNLPATLGPIRPIFRDNGEISNVAGLFKHMLFSEVFRGTVNVMFQLTKRKYLEPE